MRPSSAHTTTETHRSPIADAADEGRPALLAAFPVPVGLALPSMGEAVGRAWLAERGVRDRQISTFHARFAFAGKAVGIEDAGSRNGVFVDGERVPPGSRRALDDGAVIRLGNTLLVYRSRHAGPLDADPPEGRLVGPWGLREVRAKIAQIGESRERNVLIEGETGSGKELVAAHVIHALGRSKRTASVNVASVSATVFEGQLFGWIKGAFSDSGEGAKGVLREHDGGAVFLDEIGELQMPLQAKLLRVLEERAVLPVGAGRAVPVDVAIVAATNRPVEEAVEQQILRRDLVARFTGRIALPRLAARPEDLWAILSDLARRRGAALDPEKVEVEAMERLMLDPWPGNVRDLDRLLASLRPGEPLALRAVERVFGPRRADGPLTREALEQALAACGNNQSAAARRLGITWGTMQRRMKQWGLGRTKA